MSREHNDFINGGDVHAEAVVDGPFAGAAKRVLSRDGQSAAETALVRLPPGWSSELEGLAGPLELMALTGEVRLGSQTVPREGWVRLPHAGELGALSTTAEVELLVMTDPSAPAGGPPAILDVNAQPWQQGVRGGPGGVAVKTLYEGSTVSLVIANVPRYHSGPEFHECPEELYVLAGDVTGRHGAMTTGSYFWRPEYITHGPYWSESGLIVFARGHGDIFAHWIERAHATVEENMAYAAALRR